MKEEAKLKLRLKGLKKLKKMAGKYLVALSKFPQEKVPKLADGGLDIEAFNKLPGIEVVKKSLIGASIDILGENVINREWFQDNGFLVAGLILRFDKPIASESKAI